MADEPFDLTSLTVDLVSAFLSHNQASAADLPELIRSTHEALAGLSNAVEAPGESPAPEHVPAVTVRKSLASRDHIISMIDGKPYRSLKRHLSAKGLTFDEYRTRYNLPASYPAVAPGYSEARREISKRLGLGRKPKAPVAETPPAPTRRGRPKKVSA